MNSSSPQKKILGKMCKKNNEGSTKLSIENADISEEITDVIVNTTTEEMKLHESAVSKAISKKAGPLLQSACDQLVQSGSRLDHGQIITTESFGRLQCKKIIHAHLPNRSLAVKSGIDHFSMISEIVTKCLTKTEEEALESISLPAFGLGLGGYKVKDVAEPMLQAIQEFGQSNPKSVHTVRIVIYDQTLYSEFFDYFTTFFNLDTSIPMKIVQTIKSVWNGSSERFVELQNSSNSASNNGNSASKEVSLEMPSNSLLLFSIYTSSKDKCDKIEEELKKIIKESCKEEIIDNPIISELIDIDRDEIIKIGTEQGVKVSILAQIGNMEIIGEKNLVITARLKITNLLMEIEKCKSDLLHVQWQSSEKNDIETYSPSDSFKLERAKIKDLEALNMVIDDIEMIIDLKKMEERNPQTGNVRKITRGLKRLVSLPPTWESQPLEEGKPDGKPVAMHMFDVTQDSPEYDEALRDFHQGISNVTIIKLQRIQNPSMYTKHDAFLESLSAKYPSKKIDVKHLFHGSKEESASLIATQGFNRNFASDANAALYGQGSYFALKPSYSAQTKYAAPNKEGHQFMFICRVIVGEYTKGNQKMKVAPPLKTGSKEVFDTLVENEKAPTIFVAMTDGQAYPEYLITFKTEKK